MSEINAIATNNFILHNIDAKKLYVQEPLFTANSGDAVYVGWRPDETVLWEGNLTANAATGALSEPPSSFNDLRVEWYGENPTQYGLKCNYFHNDGLNFTGLACGGLAQTYENYAMGHHFGYLTLTNDKVTLVRQCRYNFNTTGLGAFTSGAGMFRLQRIVGINKKENA